MNLGYIGLGHMGIPCVRNLLRAGHTIHIWSRRPAAAAPLVQEGARLSPDIVSLAQEVDILFLNVRDTNAVEEILLHTGGVHECGKKGLLVVDMSSISYTATRRMAQVLALNGIELVDAPVSGGAEGAENKTLSFMVGAKPATFERIKGLLLDMGNKVTLVGDTGAGQVAQGCNQILVAATLAALGEALEFAEKGGVKLKKVREALVGGNVTSPILEIYAKHLIQDNFEPGFTTELHHADMAQVVKTAKEAGLDLPFAKAITELLHKAVEAGHGDEDSSIVAKLMAEGAKPKVPAGK